MSESGAEITTIGGVVPDPGSQIVVASPQGTDFSFEDHPSCTTHFNPAGRTAFRVSKQYCIATIHWSDPESRAQAEHSVAHGRQRLKISIPFGVTLGELSLSSPGKVRLQSWETPPPCFRKLHIKADMSENESEAVIRAKAERANNCTDLELVSVESISLICFGVNTDEVEFETSGRLLSIMRFPERGGSIRGQWGAMGLMLGGRPENATEASVLNIVTNTGPVALETVLVDGESFDGYYVAESANLCTLNMPMFSYCGHWGDGAQIGTVGWKPEVIKVKTDSGPVDAWFYGADDRAYSRGEDKGQMVRLRQCLLVNPLEAYAKTSFSHPVQQLLLENGEFQGSPKGKPAQEGVRHTGPPSTSITIGHSAKNHTFSSEGAVISLLGSSEWRVKVVRTDRVTQPTIVQEERLLGSVKKAAHALANSVRSALGPKSSGTETDASPPSGKSVAEPGAAVHTRANASGSRGQSRQLANSKVKRHSAGDFELGRSRPCASCQILLPGDMTLDKLHLRAEGSLTVLADELRVHDLSKKGMALRKPADHARELDISVASNETLTCTGLESVGFSFPAPAGHLKVNARYPSSDSRMEGGTVDLAMIGSSPTSREPCVVLAHATHGNLNIKTEADAEGNAFQGAYSFSSYSGAPSIEGLTKSPERSFNGQVHQAQGDFGIPELFGLRPKG